MNKNLKIDWEFVKKCSDTYSRYYGFPLISIDELKLKLQKLYDTMIENTVYSNVSEWIFKVERKQSADPNIPVCVVTINFKLDYWFEE